MKPLMSRYDLETFCREVEVRDKVLKQEGYKNIRTEGGAAPFRS